MSTIPTAPGLPFDWPALTERAQGPFRASIKAYLGRRWGQGDEAEELAGRVIGSGEVGWTEGLEERGQPWMATHPLAVALRDLRGGLRTLIRRWTGLGPPKDGKKALRLSKETHGGAELGTLVLGDAPAAFAAAAQGAPLLIVEGEVDTLLALALVKAGLIQQADYPVGSQALPWQAKDQRVELATTE